MPVRLQKFASYMSDLDGTLRPASRNFGAKEERVTTLKVAFQEQKKQIQTAVQYCNKLSVSLHH
jgi:hypothetical protein